MMAGATIARPSRARKNSERVESSRDPPYPIGVARAVWSVLPPRLARRLPSLPTGDIAMCRSIRAALVASLIAAVALPATTHAQYGLRIQRNDEPRVAADSVVQRK